MPNSGKRKGASREIDISKNLSYLLRHGAESEGIELDDGGWASVADVLLWRRIASLKVDLAELQSIVATNDKKRYQIEPNPSGALRSPSARTSTTSSSDPSHWRIRATQGHSIMTVTSEQIGTPILLTDADCPSLVVHGTDERPWKEIQRSGGMKPMGRKHMHFATKLPANLPPLDRHFQSRSRPKEDVDKVVSGMRSTSTVCIWVDVKRALEGGVKWWRSENGVVLTEGVGEPRMLGFEWVKWVERRGTGEVLFGEKVVSGEVGELERRLDGLSVGLGDGGEGGKGKVSDGGQGFREKGGGKTVVRSEEANRDEKPGPAAAVKDYWHD